MSAINSLIAEGQGHLAAGRLQEASQALNAALRHDPQSAAATMMLGGVMYMANDLGAAAGCFRQVLQFMESPQARVNLAMTFMASGDLAQAVEEADQAGDALSPNDHRVVADVYATAGHHASALRHADAALLAQPGDAEMHICRGLALLGLGRHREGWAECEWRSHRNADVAARARYRLALTPRWDGKPTGHLAIFHEQGAGDTLMWSRLIPLALRRCTQLTFVVPRSLEALMRDSFPLVGVTNDPPPHCDHYAWVDSLPGLLAADQATFRPPAYLLAAKEGEWRRTIAGCRRMKVGLAWAGDARNRIDRWRSLPAEAFDRLAALDVDAFSLQKGVRPPPGIVDLSHAPGFLGTWQDTAGLVAAMDLVITVDTAVAHLAGALGKPTWLLQRHNGCWRWVGQGWYPSVRIFRQPSLGDWPGVMDAARQALDGKLRQR